MRFRVLCTLPLVLLGCEEPMEERDSSVTTDTAPPTDTAPTDSAPADTGAMGLSCSGLIDCVTDCPGDAMCAEGCFGMARVDGLADELAMCASAAECRDEACIMGTCPTELAACDAAPDAPVAIEGTARDTLATLGMDSIGTLRFVRDDAAGAAVGLGGPDMAFYRLEQADYVATQALDMGCVYSADETVSVTNPPPTGNNITFDTATGEYSIVTSLTETRAMALTIECPAPAGTMQEDFQAGLNISNGTTLPVSDGRTFVDSAMPPAGVDRTWSWDLAGVF